MYLGYCENVENPKQHYFSTSIKEFMLQLYKFNQANVYFHNLEYDGTFIFDSLIGEMGYVNLCVDEYDYGYDQYIVGNPSRFTLYKKKRNEDWIILNFIDTFKAFPTSVRKLGKMVSTNDELLKGDTPLYENMDEVNARSKKQVEYDKWYCQRDVQIVSKFLRANNNYYLQLFEQGLYTTAGIAMKSAKNEIKPRKEDREFKPLCKCLHYKPIEIDYVDTEWFECKKKPFDITTYYPKLTINKKKIKQHLKEDYTNQHNDLERGLKSKYRIYARNGLIRYKYDGTILSLKAMKEHIDDLTINGNWYHVYYKFKNNTLVEYYYPLNIKNNECFKYIKKGLTDKTKPKKLEYAKWIDKANKDTLPDPDKSKITQHGMSAKVERINAIIKPHYKGGISWVNPKNQNKICGHGWTLDVNSMHPANMRYKKLPGKLNTIIKYVGQPITVDEIQSIINQTNQCHFIIFDKLKAKTKDGCMPIFKGNTNDELNQHDNYEDTINFRHFGLTDVELQYLIDCYDIDIAIPYRRFVFDTIPEESRTQLNQFIDDNYALKSEYGQKGDEVSRYITKLKLNSFYGQNGFSNKEIEQVRWRYVIKDKQLMKTKIGKPYIITGKDAYVPVAAWTTAYSRVEIGRTANAVGLDNFLYSDTDSVHFLSPIRSKEELEKWCTGKGIQISDTILGAWKIEEEFEKGKYIRAKTYMEEDKDGNRTLHAAGYNGEEDLGFEQFKSGYCVIVTRSTIVSGGRQIKQQIQMIDGEITMQRFPEIAKEIEAINQQIIKQDIDNLQEIVDGINHKLARV